MSIVKQFPILYKRSNTKKIIIWIVSVIEKNKQILIQIKRGQENGKMVITEKEIKNGKGKKTIQEQALFEANSKWNNKIKQQGYLEDKKKAESSIIIKPMLAHKFTFEAFNKKSRSTKIILPCFAQPKLDGLRCIANLENGSVILRSRQLIEYQFLNKIKQELKTILNKLPNDFYFDGELYTNNLSFERIAGLCRLKKDISKQDHIDMLKIEYHIYDCFQTQNLKIPYTERLLILQKYLKNTKRLQYVNTIEIINQTEIKKNHDLFVKEGYEGLILRNKNSVYELDKRSKHLQKYKEFIEDEFKIIGYEEGTGLFKGSIIWVCETKDKKQFKATPKGSMEYRRQLLIDADKYIGKQLTIIYQELTCDKIPRFPIGKAIRDKY